MARESYLDGIAAKIHRADEHIGNLNAEITSFLRDNYRVGRHFDAESRQYRFTAFGDATVPLRVAVIIGEIVHQLRSALDHVITQLNAIGPGGGKADVLEFPICRSASSFKRACGRGKIEGVSVAAATRIQQLQPYRTSDPAEHASLYVLHDLDITDKHRLLLTVVAVVYHADRLEIDAKRDVEVIGMSPPIPREGVRPSKDGTEVFSIDFGEKFDPDVDVKGNFSFQIAFDHPGVLKHLPIFPTIVQLRKLVVNTIQGFFPNIVV